MVELIEKNIDGKQIKILEWSAQTAILNKFRLIEVLGDAVSIFTKISNKENLTENETVEIIKELFNNLFNNSTPEQLTEIIIDFCTGVSVGSERLSKESFEKMKSKDIIFIYKIFIEVIKVNYSGIISNEVK